MLDKVWVTLLVLGLLGAGMVIAGGVLIPFFKTMIHNDINRAVPMAGNDSESFKTWKDPPAPVYIEFYLFNVTNSKDVLHGSAPNLTERGPYVYREIRPKGNIVFNDNFTLSYTQNKSYVFQRNMSIGDPEKDKITTVNLLFLAIADKARNLPPFLQAALNIVLQLEDLFIEKSVHGYLWGYHDPLIEAINNITEHSFLNKSFLDSTTGIFYGPTGNGSNDGIYNIFTGTDDVGKFNFIDKWERQNNLSFWTSSACNSINGTDGTGWHPFVKKTEELQLFSSDICRSINLLYEKQYNLQNINLYRFIPASNTFSNSSKNPQNQGFCTEHSGCLDDGVLDVYSCKGAPIVMSQPHFYQGAKQYKDAVRGMHPEKELHETFVDVEPMTGAAMNVSKKLQINAFIHNVSLVYPDTENLTVSIFPLLWLNERATIDDDGIKKFQHAVITPIKVTIGVKYGLVALGAFLIIVIIIVAIIKFVRQSRENGESWLTPISGDTGPLMASADDH